MRTFLREYPPEYDRYRFNYGCFAELEPGDPLDAAYEAGFLPASNDTREPACLFYLARSLRLDLSEVRFDKKRRYLQRRGTDNGLQWKLETKEQFLAAAPVEWAETALAWVARRYDPPYLTADRLRYLLGRPFLSHIATVSAAGHPVGFVLLPQGEQSAHFWFSLYDPDWHPERSLGKWMLGASIENLQERGFRFLYLGTCYGQRSAYKFQGITSGVSFFDANAWSGKMEELEARLRLDP